MSVLQSLLGLWAWTKANPLLMTAIVWPLLTAVLTWLFKPRTPDEYASLAAVWPRVAAALKLIAALGVDPVKLVEAMQQLWSGTAKPAYTQLPKGPPRMPPPMMMLTMALSAFMLLAVACTKAQTLDVVGLIEEKTACALSNLDLPDNQIIAKCAIDPSDWQKIVKIVEDGRAREAKAAAQAHARGLLEGQHAGCGAPDGGK